MLILSKHKDYYDSAVGMGIDKTIVYERHTRQEHIPDELNNLFDKHANYSLYRQFIGNIPEDKYETRLVHIGFCGKIYIGLVISKEVPDGEYLTKKIYKLLWDFDKIRKLLKKDVKKSKYSWFRNQQSDLKYFNNYVAKIDAYDATKWFRKFNTPIFVVGVPPINDTYGWKQKFGMNNEDGHLYINPILKDYQFAKVFDPYTAFQEIQMYVSGVLGVNKDGTELPATEKQKVAQHGMNKWSFRTPSRK
jgi:hypothetical protein